MKNVQKKSSMTQTTNYLNKKYRNSSLRKLMIKTYYDKHFPKKKLSDETNINHSSFSNFYYKNPKFYNEKNLNFQMTTLKKFSKYNLAKNINNRKFTYTKQLSSFFENEDLPNLKRNNTVNLNNKLIIDNNKNKYKNLTNKRNTFFFNRSNTEGNFSEEITKNNDELATKKLYKMIFKSQLPTNKDHIMPIIENKYNLKYSENEEQYNFIIDKEYEEKIAKGEKIKNKKSCPSIKLKLNETLEKVKFMKDVIDYSYPLFVLSKIKIQGKNLRYIKERRNNTQQNYISEKEKRIKEVKLRNDIRTQYLLKSFSFFK